MYKGSDSSLKSSLVTLYYMTEITVDNNTTELRSLSAMGIVERWVARPRWYHLITKDQVGMVTAIGNRV